MMTSKASPAIPPIHQRAIIVDALTPLYVLDEPYTSALAEGGVSCGFLSIASPQSWDEVLKRTEMALTKIEASPLLTLAASAEDIRRAKRDGKIALVLITQAMDMVEKDPQRVRVLHGLGFRVLGMCYTFANLLGCGCGELRDGGVTFLGKDVISAINELPMMVDVSHSGHQTSLDAAKLARAPVITHANAYTVTPNDRNKKDEVIRVVADKGGVIGLNALPATVSAEHATLSGMLDHVDYITRTFGMASMGLGLDYVEGFKKAGHIMPQSVRNRTLRPDIFGSVDDFLNLDYAAGLERIDKLPALTHGLIERGYADFDVERILGRNWLDAFERFVG